MYLRKKGIGHYFFSKKVLITNNNLEKDIYSIEDFLDTNSCDYSNYESSSNESSDSD